MPLRCPSVSSIVYQSSRSCCAPAALSTIGVASMLPGARGSPWVPVGIRLLGMDLEVEHAAGPARLGRLLDHGHRRTDTDKIEQGRDVVRIHADAAVAVAPAML